MTETEIRNILDKARDELRRCVRSVVLPTALGAGLALAGCDDSATPPKDGGNVDAQADANTQADSNKSNADGPGLPVDTLQKIDLPPVVPYMAPDVDPLYLSLGEPGDDATA